jgi:hypothetical protein
MLGQTERGSSTNSPRRYAGPPTAYVPQERDPDGHDDEGNYEDGNEK